MSAPKESGDASGSGCLALFAAPFALAGAAILYQGWTNPAEQDEPLWVILVAGALFLGVGVGLGTFALTSGADAKKQKQLRERFPGEPWKWRPEWESGRIPDDQRTVLFTSWAIALFWNGITALTAAGAWREVRGEPWWPALLLFPLVGAGLLYWALKETVRYVRHGRAWFEIERPPGVIGGRLRGTVRTALSHPPPEGFKIRLQALRAPRNGDSSSEHLLWKTERTVSIGELGRQAGTVVVPINIAIPHDAEETDESGRPRIRWRLSVGATLPGPDYSANFIVPVFRVPGREEAHSARHGFDEDPEPAGPAPYRERVRPDGLVEYYFPAGRSPGAAIAMTIMLLIWMGALAGMLWFEIPWIFVIVWALFAVLLTWATLELWFSSIRVWFEGDEIVVRRALLGVGRIRRLRLADIRLVSVDIGMSQGRTATQEGRVWYDVNLHSLAGSRVAAGASIREKGHAERFAALLRRRVEQRTNGDRLRIEN